MAVHSSYFATEVHHATNSDCVGSPRIDGGDEQASRCRLDYLYRDGCRVRETGATTFADSIVTITAQTDTSLVFFDTGAGVYKVLVTPTVSVLGASGTFTDSIQAVSNPNVPDAGFGDIPMNLGILFTLSQLFHSYDLKSPIGPVFGTAGYSDGAAYATTAGAFVLDAVTSVSFQASTVPEPSAMVLAGMSCIAGLACAWWRRRQLGIRRPKSPYPCPTTA